MKKLFSFAAALVVAMVVLVSCASENTKNAVALGEAIKGGDDAKVAELINTMVSVKDQLTADEATVVLEGYLWQAGNSADEAKAEAANNAIAFYDVVKAKEGADKSFETAKNAGLDIDATVEAMKAQIAEAEAAAAAAAQAAADSTAADSTDAEEVPAE